MKFFASHRFFLLQQITIHTSTFVEEEKNALTQWFRIVCMSDRNIEKKKHQ